MYPAVNIGSVSVSTFTLCAIAGVTAFILSVLYKISKFDNFAAEAYFILPKLFIACGAGFVGAVFFDALVKIPENGGFRISGITFYGGAVTGTAVLAAELAAFSKRTRLSVIGWLNLVTVPFLIFHFFGRIGCFFGGCCYGKPTNGIWGVAFPDNAEAGIYHYGQKVFPTQLFEAAAIAAIALTLVLAKIKNAFAVYCVAYPVARFAIEFLRGDDRGGFAGVFSPAQIFSLVILGAAVIVIAVTIIKKRRADRRKQT